MPKIFGLTSEALPAGAFDGVQAQARMSRYGEFGVNSFMSPPYYPHALEGMYYKATHQTPGTAVAYSITTAFSALASFFFLYNGDATKRLFLDYIKLIPTTAPASATSGHFALAIDDTNRYTSGGSSFTPQNVNSAVANASIATCRAGALVNPVVVAARYVDRGVLFAAIPVVNSEFVLAVGSQAAGAGTLGGTVATRTVIPLSPVVVAPGDCMLLHLWFPANAVTAPQFEFEAAWWER